jgi:NADP-dependent 3-hydroxy acid dehydrogenase YdfG
MEAAFVSRTIAVFGAGPGLGRSVARQFGREGYQVALVARTPARLEALTAELAAEGITVAGFPADLADRAGLPGLIEAITARFGPIDVLEYAPAGPEWLDRQTHVLDTDDAALSFPLDLLLRTPVSLVRLVLPGMLERRQGAVLFGLAATPDRPYPQVANVAAASAAARTYLLHLHTALADTGVYAGLLQVGGLIGGSDAAGYFAAKFGAAALPEPIDPADLARALWDLSVQRDRFEVTVA